MSAKKIWGMNGIAMALVVLALSNWTGLAQAQDGNDLEQLLEDMSGAYAEGYLAPLVTGFGINQNSALYHTAFIPGTTVTISLGLKVMGTKLSDEDQTFRVVRNITINEDYGVNPGEEGYGEDGVVVMSGPTVFGSEDEGGRMTVLYHGLPVHVEDLSDLTGLVESKFVPLAMPQASVGGIMGMEATLRWLPDIEIQSGVKVKLWGIGLAASANYWLPTLPVDVKVGFFNQSLDVGDYVATDARSLYVVASKEFSMLTAYGGLSRESSSMDVTYTYSGTGEEIAFSLDGVQKNRMTIGATLNLGLKINGEIGLGDLTSFSGGLMFGF
ncbi:hypothetical protein KKG45_11670 [bacterium]|nr:hypothetical protein [bacterium]MBU1073894.1 hypothetical protein [bacterium]